MYKPNRIGPCPLMHIDQGKKVYGSLAAGHLVAQDTVNFILPDATIRTNTSSRAFTGSGSWGTNKQATLGVAVNGAHPGGAQTLSGAIGFHLDISGMMMVRVVSHPAEVSGLAIYGILARNDAATLQTFATEPSNVAANWMMVPTHCESNDLGFTAWFNQTVVIGNYDGAETYSADPLMAGFAIHSTAGETQTASFVGSVNMHKYIHDINTHDPSRT